MLNGAGVNLVHARTESSSSSRHSFSSSSQRNSHIYRTLSVSLQMLCLLTFSFFFKFAEDHFRCFDFKGAERSMKLDKQHE